MIREFEQAHGEDAKSFKWSYDGQYFAKITKKALKVEEEEETKESDQIEEKEEVVRTYITVYEMPVCKIITDAHGDRTSIKVDGLESFEWAPHKNIIAHTSFPEGENALPRITL